MKEYSTFSKAQGLEPQHQGGLMPGRGHLLWEVSYTSTEVWSGYSTALANKADCYVVTSNESTLWLNYIITVLRTDLDQNNFRHYPEQIYLTHRWDPNKYYHPG